MASTVGQERTDRRDYPECKIRSTAEATDVFVSLTVSGQDALQGK